MRWLSKHTLLLVSSDPQPQCFHLHACVCVRDVARVCVCLMPDLAQAEALHLRQRVARSEHAERALSGAISPPPPLSAPLSLSLLCSGWPRARTVEGKCADR